MGKPVLWRLEGDVLVEEGPKARRLPLSTLRAANLSQEARGLGRRILRLTFARAVVRIPSHSFDKPLSLADQSAAFAEFARQLLAAAAQAAPAARFETGESKVGRLYIGAAAIIAAGLALTLLASLVADAPALGVEMAARLSFVLLLMFAAWPWIGSLGVRPFDPRAVPQDLLP